METKLLILVTIVASTFISCNKKPPSIIKTELISVNDTLAIVSAEIINEDNSKILKRGFAWSLTANPTVENYFIEDHNAGNSISIKIPNLTPLTKYYVRAFVEDKKGITYGDQLSFSTSYTIISEEGNGVTDFDGNFYPTIVLGNGQEWMAENLRTTHCSDGTIIPHVENHNDWYNLSSPAWTFYDNNQQYNTPYGKLYNWYAVSDCSICPIGWRVPTVNDWNQLLFYLSPNLEDGGSNDAASKMKVTGSNYWYGPNNDATNISGFSAYPGGLRGNGFHSIEYGGYWWSDSLRIGSPGDLPEAYYRVTVKNNPSLGGGFHYVGDGLSIRCIKE